MSNRDSCCGRRTRANAVYVDDNSPHRHSAKTLLSGRHRIADKFLMPADPEVRQQRIKDDSVPADQVSRSPDTHAKRTVHVVQADGDLLRVAQQHERQVISLPETKVARDVL